MARMNRAASLKDRCKVEILTDVRIFTILWKYLQYFENYPTTQLNKVAQVVTVIRKRN